MLEEENKILRVVTKIFVLILILICIGIFIRIFAKNVLVDRLGINNNITKILAYSESTEETQKEIKWDEIYPFETENNNNLDNNALQSSSDKENNNSIINKYSNVIEKIKGQLNNYSNTYLFGYEKIVEIAKAYENNINWNLIRLNDENTAIEIAEDNWSWIRGKEDFSPIANNISEFNEYLKEKDIEMLYVQAPAKIENLSNGGMLDIYKDYTKENTDKFIEMLTNNSVDVLDLRKKMNEDNINYLDAFYKTDHHWRPETGLWATRKIANHINEKWNMNIDISLYDKEKYKDERYEKAFLGSNGRNATLSKAKLEDFNIISPIFDTNLTIEIPSLDVNKTGTFREALINDSLIGSKDYYRNTTYLAYGYGNKALVHVKNNLIENSTENILFLKDSFGIVVLPYLSLGVGNIYEIDQRSFDGSIKKKKKKNNITKVIMLYYPGSLDTMEESLFTYE